jgi:hypothetical protein
MDALLSLLLWLLFGPAATANRGEGDDPTDRP